jgi:hypothetical protein
VKLFAMRSIMRVSAWLNSLGEDSDNQSRPEGLVDQDEERRTQE